MQTKRVDVAVIGGGTAGLTARREAAAAGASVVLIEGGAWGTTCARTGCMPSKLLIAASEVVHTIRGAGEFGIRVPDGVTVDGRAVLERLRRHRDRFVGFVIDSVEQIPAEQRLLGRARFVGPTALEVGDHTRVEARTVVIATGSRPRVPAEFAAVREAVLTHENAFELPDLPASIGIIGSGVIGLEIGQALHRLGVRTTVFARSDLLGPLSDPAVRDCVAQVFSRELDVHCNVTLTVARAAEGFVLRWRDEDAQAQERHVAALLAAAGRVPQFGDLGLEHTGVELDAGGVPRFDPHTMQCGAAPIFLAGDASAYRPLLHEAADEGRIAGQNAVAFPAVRSHTRRTPLMIVFTDPNVAMVGAPFASLDPQTVEVGCVSYADQGRAVVMARNAGVVRIYAQRDCGTLVGAEMCGPDVEHTAHLLAWAIQSRLTVETALEMPFYHPTTEEGIRTALRDLSARLKQRGPERRSDLECGPGA